METDIDTASGAVDYRGEGITQMEPLRIRDGSRHRTDLTDMTCLPPQSSLPAGCPDCSREGKPERKPYLDFAKT